MGSGAWALGLFLSQFLGPRAHPLVWYFFSLVLLVSLVVISFVVISFVVLSANNSNVNMQHTSLRSAQSNVHVCPRDAHAESICSSCGSQMHMQRADRQSANGQ